MKIELSSIKHNKMLSRETPAFTATVVINDIVRGTVHNSGNGGAIIWQDYDAEREITEYAATLPPVDFDGVKIPQSAETILFDLVYDSIEDAEEIDPIGDNFRNEGTK